jgi:hypothetical protein
MAEKQLELDGVAYQLKNILRYCSTSHGFPWATVNFVADEIIRECVPRHEIEKVSARYDY